MTRRHIVLISVAVWGGVAVANPMNEKVPFAMEEGLACATLLNEAAKDARPAKPFGPDEAHEAAFWGYAMGSAALAKRAAKGPKFVDQEVERRGLAVRAMHPADRKAATATCVTNSAQYQASAKRRR